MDNYFHSKTFDFQGTEVPCVFTFDPEQELLWVEPCEELYIERGYSPDNDDYDRVEQLCGSWGSKGCASLAQANRLIRQSFPYEWEGGTRFREIHDE